MGSRWLFTDRIAHSHSSPVNPMTHVLNLPVYSVLTESNAQTREEDDQFTGGSIPPLFVFFYL
jgi:hypothetical protein